MKSFEKNKAKLDVISEKIDYLYGDISTLAVERKKLIEDMNSINQTSINKQCKENIIDINRNLWDELIKKESELNRELNENIDDLNELFSCLNANQNEITVNKNKLEKKKALLQKYGIYEKTVGALEEAENEISNMCHSIEGELARIEVLSALSEKIDNNVGFQDNIEKQTVNEENAIVLDATEKIVTGTSEILETYNKLPMDTMQRAESSAKAYSNAIEVGLFSTALIAKMIADKVKK